LVFIFTALEEGHLDHHYSEAMKMLAHRTMQSYNRLSQFRGEDGCMQGGIYTREDCPICGKRLKDNLRNAVCCTAQPEIRARRMFVRFGREHARKFTVYSVASKWLNHLRYEKDEREENFDIEDYGAKRPKSVKALAPSYLEEKRKENLKTIDKIEHTINLAVDYWGATNFRDIDDPAIEDFLNSIPDIGAKTRSNYQVHLRGFWKFACKRKAILKNEMPDFEPIKYKLGYRKITTWEIQRQVIDKVKEMSYSINPRIWLGIDMLATYTELRPDDLRRIREGDYQDGFITIFEPTKSERKNQPWITIKLLDEHQEAWEEIRNKFPAINQEMPFFRHHKGRARAKPGSVFSDKYLARWWNRATKEIGLEGVSLYPGTRHTTTTETSRMLGPDEAKKATGHRTNKAFERYNQAINDGAFQVVSKIRKKMTGKVIPLKKGHHEGTTVSQGK